MAEASDDAAAETDLTDGLEKKGMSGKKIIIIAGAAVVVLIIVIVVVMMLMGGGDDHGDDHHEEDSHIDKELDDVAAKEAEDDQKQQLEADATPEELQLLFIDVGKKVYNLNTGGQGSSFLTVTIQLEVDRESYRADVEAKMPRVLDEFNTYMRELRPSDLEGAAGIFRLKEELLLRINQAVSPSRVKDVLMQEFLIQGGT